MSKDRVIWNATGTKKEFVHWKLLFRMTIKRMELIYIWDEDDIPTDMGWNLEASKVMGELVFWLGPECSALCYNCSPRKVIQQLSEPFMMLPEREIANINAKLWTLKCGAGAKPRNT